MQGSKYPPGATFALSLNAATTGTGSVHAFNDCRQTIWTVTTNGEVTDGTVIIESSNDAAYAGTWTEQDSVDLAAMGTDEKYSNTYPAFSAGFWRARVSETVVGGTVSVELNGSLL